MKSWKQKDKSLVQEKVLDVTASMQGTLRFDDPVNLRISGKFEGTLDTKGALWVGQQANIRANITGENVSIAGNVEGNIKAAKILRLEVSARIKGEIETPRLIISEGAVLNGRVKMSQTEKNEILIEEKEDKMTINQLAKYLEVEPAKVTDWVVSGKLPGIKDGNRWTFERVAVDQWIADGKVK